MSPDLTSALAALKQVLSTLDAQPRDRPQNAGLAEVHEHVAAAVGKLKLQLETLDASTASTAAPPPSRPGLAGQIKLLTELPEAFRTRINVKPRVAVSDQNMIAALPDTAHGMPPQANKSNAETPFSAAPGPDGAHAASDDFTRIRGIDGTTARRLASAGVTRFAAIAIWNRTDIDRLSAELGLGRRIFQENWIAQAALLAPASDSNGRLQPTAAEPIAASVASVEPATAMAADGSMVSTPFAPVADFAEVLEAVPEIEAMIKAQAPASAAATVLPPAVDPLHEIRGIDIHTAQRLHDIGVTRFEHLATWSAGDKASAQATLGQSACISRDNWIEQAALLARGIATWHANRVRQGTFDALVAYPAAEPLAMPIFRSAAAEIAATTPATTMLAPAAPAAQPPNASRNGISAEPTDPASAMFTSPSIIDRLAVLEAELAALAANDKMPATPAGWLEPPSVPAKTVSPPFAAQSTRHVEDDLFPELSVEEADVKIVSRSQPSLRPQAERIGLPSPRTLVKRLERLRDGADPNSDGHVEIRPHIEEANVEIVRRRPPQPEQR